MADEQLPIYEVYIFYTFYQLCRFFCGIHFKSTAQSANPCGVIARIYPATTDSVVTSSITIPFSSTSINATSVYWLLDGLPSGGTSTNYNYTITPGVHTIGLVALKDNCADTITVVYFNPGSHNVDTLLMGEYGTAVFNEDPTCINSAPDGGLIAGGVQYGPTNNCGEGGILIKLRDKGCIDWSRKILSPNYCSYSRVTSVTASADTSYYVGIAAEELAKFDKAGNMLWHKKYVLDNQNLLSIAGVYSFATGSAYLLGSTVNNGWTVTKIDNNGNVSWNKFLRLSYNTTTEFATATGMVFLNGKLFISGNTYNTDLHTNFSFLTRLDAATGNKEWQYGYTDPQVPNSQGFMHLALYDTLLMASSATSGQLITLIDQQGLVKKSITTHFATSFGAHVTRAATSKNGHIYMMQWLEQPLPLQPYYQYYTNFAEIDTSLKKYWGVVISNYSRTFFNDAVMGRDNKFAALGSDFGKVNSGILSSWDLRLLKADSISTVQYCFGTDTSYTVIPKTINRINFQYQVDSALSITATTGTDFQVQDGGVQSRYVCPDYIDSCSFMKLTGPTNLCSLSDTYIYRMHRNKRCVLLPTWQLSPGITIVHQTYSTLEVKFSSLGTYKIAASLYSCIPIRDSVKTAII